MEATFSQTWKVRTELTARASISLLFSLLCVLANQDVYGQSCQNPTPLCPGESSQQSMEFGVPISFDCFSAQYTHFMQFTTVDFDPAEILDATVTLSVSTCMLNDTVPGNVMMIVVEAPQGADLCNPASYSNPSGCVEGTTNAQLVLNNVQPNTTYTLIVGTDVDALVSACNFNLSISGPAMQITACCDGQIALGDPYEMEATGSPTGEYSWFPTVNMEGANTGNPTVFPEEITTYTVSAEIGECTVTAIMTVFVGPPIVIPNTITPNGDGINDVWTMAGINRFPDCTVTVYTRWGQKIFDSIGYATPWDGTFDGKRLPTATYYYVIELNSSDVKIEPLTGSISLIH
jgi:gliding motility-associated-like protein